MISSPVTVIELCRPGALPCAAFTLRVLKRTARVEVSRDAGSQEGVTPDLDLRAEPRVPVADGSAKNSRKRRAAWSPASATIARTATPREAGSATAVGVPESQAALSCC